MPSAQFPPSLHLFLLHFLFLLSHPSPSPIPFPLPFPLPFPSFHVPTNFVRGCYQLSVMLYYHIIGYVLILLLLLLLLHVLILLFLRLILFLTVLKFSSPRLPSHLLNYSSLSTCHPTIRLFLFFFSFFLLLLLLQR